MFHSEKSQETVDKLWITFRKKEQIDKFRQNILKILLKIILNLKKRKLHNLLEY